MTNDQIKIKQRVVNQKGFGWVLGDVLTLISDDLGIEPEADEDIGSIVKKYMNQLRNKYKREMKRESVAVHQVSLEELIMELRLEDYAKIIKLENGKETK